MAGLLDAIGGMLGKPSGGKPESAAGGDNQASQSDADRLKCIQDSWLDLKNAYIVYHQSVWETFLFYANQSWIEWDEGKKTYVPNAPDDDWVPRPRINRFSPTVDAVASNIYQIPEVEASAIPEDDPDSTMIAEIASKLATYCINKEGLKRQKDSQEDRSGLAAQLFVLSGSLFTIVCANKKVLGQRPKTSQQTAQAYQCDNCDKYNVLPIGQQPPKFCPECGQPVDAEDLTINAQDMGPDGSPMTEDVEEFDICLEVGNPLAAFPRAGSKSMDDSPKFLWAERVPLDTIYFKYNKFEAEADSEYADGYSVTYEHALNFWYTGYSSSSQQSKDSCMVVRAFIEPNKVKDHPNGFYGCMINQKMAYSEDWVFPAHPVTMFKYLNLPTIFMGRSVSFDLVQLQRELNAYESVIKLHSMVAAVDPIVVDANTIVSEITGRSDKVIKWRSIGPNSDPPHRMGSGHLDDGIYKQRDNLHSEFQNVSMAVNAFRGEQEGAITASSAIQQLRSQAELMFSKPVGNWNNGWCETVRKYVKFMQFYMTLEQLAAIVGPGKEQELQKFKTADLDKTTEWIPSSHGLPKTRDERRQELMTMWDKGALDLNQPSVRKEIYDLFGSTGMMQAFNKHATNARLENTAIKNGAGWMGPAIPGPDGLGHMAPVPGPNGQIVPAIKPQPVIEDMATHKYFHVDQAISQDFKKWPQPAQVALIEHIMETEAEIQKQALSAQLMSGMAGGKPPGGKPGPGQPGPGGPPKALPAPGHSNAPAGQQSQAQVHGQSGAVESQGAQ